MSQAVHFDYLVINADFETAVQDFANIAQAARLLRERLNCKNDVKELVGAGILSASVLSWGGAGCILFFLFSST